MDKIQNTHDAEYWNNAHLCSSILRGWHKIKPGNEEIRSVMNALQEMSFYVARLKHDAQAKDKIVEEYKLIKQKKSKLSSRLRNEVVECYNRQYKKELGE